MRNVKGRTQTLPCCGTDLILMDLEKQMCLAALLKCCESFRPPATVVGNYINQLKAVNKKHLWCCLSSRRQYLPYPIHLAEAVKYQLCFHARFKARTQ